MTKSTNAVSASVTMYKPPPSGGGGGGSGAWSPPASPLIDNNGLNFIANLEVYYEASYMHYDSNGNLISIDRHDNDADLGYGYDYGTWGDKYKELLGGTISGGTTLTATEALLLQWELETCAQAIIDTFGHILTQNQLTALASLRFNIGPLSRIPGFIDLIKRGNYKRSEFEDMIQGFYRSKSSAKNLDGLLARTDKMLDLFFDNKFGAMGLDAVNGRKF